MTLAASAPAAPRPLGALPLPTPAEVLDLQSVRTYPAVSVLVSTRPAVRMRREDATRLGGLVDLALARVAAECPRDVSAAVAEQLETLAASACERPTRAGVALYTAPGRPGGGWSLPVPVVERAVVDPTFATRDLVQALHRTPRHVVLVLADDRAHLFDAAGDLLVPALGGAFPLSAAPGGTRPAGGRGARGRPRGRTVRGGRPESGPDETFLRHVDAALGSYLRVHPAPLVITGTTRTVAAFTRLSRNTGGLAGVVPGAHARSSPARLAALVRPVLEAYLRSRQDEALALLDRRTGEGRGVAGMQTVWLAARRERPEMLVVDEAFFYPARLSDDGDLVLPAPDVDHPEVVDDVVDEVIELVLGRGGWVAVVDQGRLDHADRIALTLRPG